jgi:tRNA(Ile)-lysidine synthase
MSGPDLTGLLEVCTFPPAGTPVVCGLSGGADSTALVALARAAGCGVTAIHVHHGLRPEADTDADAARTICGQLGVPLRVERVTVEPGPNLEARARRARRAALGPGALTGHTLDDQAETVLLALLRGSGATGMSAMTPGPTKPILALRRYQTEQVCRTLGVRFVVDASNADRRFRRNRIRHEVLPLLADVAERDVVPLLARAAALLRDDDSYLDHLAGAIDATDAAALASAPTPLARRALRRWLTVDGYPPDAATVDRVLAVAAGRHRACDVGRGRRIERTGGRLVLVPATGAGVDR